MQLKSRLFLGATAAISIFAAYKFGGGAEANATPPGASATTPEASVNAASAARVARRLPHRAAARPATGIATSEPTAMQASASPSSPAPSDRRSPTAGMRAAHAPYSSPLIAKVAVMARRALRMGTHLNSEGAVTGAPAYYYDSSSAMLSRPPPP